MNTFEHWAHAYSTMKVIILRDYKEENWHSMEVYADELIRHLQLLHIPNMDIRNHVVLPGLSALFPADHKYMRQFFRYVVNPLGSRFLDGDVFHITDHANSQLIAALDPKKTVITCHDLTAPYWMMEHVPLTRKKKIRHAVERWRLGFLKRAAGIIAVSEATKRQMVDILKIPKSRITVIPEGVDKSFVRITDGTIIHDVSKRLRLPKKYILHVGTTYYNKNIEGLLKIFFGLAACNSSLFLVKSGDAWTHDQERMIERSGFSNRIRHVGFVSSQDLPALYSLAEALIHPSYAEGFGFTVLEAMACGCPVVVSDIPAMREMVSDAGLYINPQSEKNQVEKIRSFLSSHTERKVLVRRGYIRAAAYSWEKTAEKTYALYARIAKRS